MALFAIQLAWVIIAATGPAIDTEEDIYLLIIGIHKMVNVVI
jgi:hypothetical protein